MAVCLSGLPGLPAFDAVGEPATLAPRWKTWKAEFELYVVASGVTDPTQQRALLLHLAGPAVRDIFKTFADEDKGGAKDYNKAIDCLSDYFKVKKNVPMERQTFLAAKPNPGETINNFASRLKSLVEHCNYGEEEDNQVRDHVISHIKNKNLKAKLYREETLTLSKLLEIVSQYHDKEALILIPEGHVNRIKGEYKRDDSTKFKGRCWKCDKVGHFSKDCRISRDHKCEKCGIMGHFEACCRSKQAQSTSPSQTSSHGRKRGRGNSHERGRRGSRTSCDVRKVTENMSAESHHQVKISTCSAPQPQRIQAIWNSM